jgi:hypothetical protein
MDSAKAILDLLRQSVALPFTWSIIFKSHRLHAFNFISYIFLKWRQRKEELSELPWSSSETLNECLLSKIPLAYLLKVKEILHSHQYKALLHMTPHLQNPLQTSQSKFISFYLP